MESIATFQEILAFDLNLKDLRCELTGNGMQMQTKWQRLTNGWPIIAGHLRERRSLLHYCNLPWNSCRCN